MDQQQPAMTGTIPSHLPAELSEFVSADFPPQDEKPVLCIRRASHNAGVQYELITARYQPSLGAFRHPWRHLDGEPVDETGHQVLGWKNAIRWLQAR